MWANDTHGLVFRSNELKLYPGPGHTWAMKLSQIAQQDGMIRIMTRYLIDIEYIIRILERRPHDIKILCDMTGYLEARYIIAELPEVQAAAGTGINASAVAISPETLYLGSMDFGRSRKEEDLVIGVRSQRAHDYFVRFFERLWQESEEL